VAAAATTLVHAIGRLAGYRCTDVLVIAQIPNGTHQDGVPLLRAAPSLCPLDLRNHRRPEGRWPGTHGIRSNPPSEALPGRTPSRTSEGAGETMLSLQPIGIALA